MSKEFSPFPGDTIEVVDGCKYTCVTKKYILGELNNNIHLNSYSDDKIFGAKLDKDNHLISWNVWDRDGTCEHERYFIQKITPNTDIHMDKTYTTRSGKLVRILATNAIGEKPVIGLIICEDNADQVCRFTKEGNVYRNGEYSMNDLIEYNLWKNMKVDTPLWTACGTPLNFSHYEGGRVHVFIDGKNSHTASGLTISYTPDSIFNVKR